MWDASFKGCNYKVCNRSTSDFIFFLPWVVHQTCCCSTTLTRWSEVETRLMTRVINSTRYPREKWQVLQSRLVKIDFQRQKIKRNKAASFCQGTNINGYQWCPTFLAWPQKYHKLMRILRLKPHFSFLKRRQEGTASGQCVDSASFWVFALSCEWTSN